MFARGTRYLIISFLCRVLFVPENYIELMCLNHTDLAQPRVAVMVRALCLLFTGFVANTKIL